VNAYGKLNYGSLLAFIVRKAWIIALAAVIFGAVSFYATKFIVAPKYSASVRLYVNNKTEDSGTLTPGDLSAAKSLVDTYVTIIESDSVIDEIVGGAGLGYTNTQLKKMLSAKSVNGTEVLEVSVAGTSPEDCAKIANAIADLAPRKITEIVDGSAVKIIDRAKVPTDPVSPSIPRNIASAFLLGAALSGIILVLIYIYDSTIYREEDLKEFCQLPILGIFPDLSYASQKKGSCYLYGYGGRSAGK